MTVEITVPRHIADDIREKLRVQCFLTEDMENDGWQSLCEKKRLSPECSRFLDERMEIMRYRQNNHDNAVAVRCARDIYQEIGLAMETVHVEMESCLIMCKSILLKAYMHPLDENIRVKICDDIMVDAGSHYEMFRIVHDFFRIRRDEYYAEFAAEYQAPPAPQDQMLRRFEKMLNTLEFFRDCALVLESHEIMEGVSISLDAGPKRNGGR